MQIWIVSASEALMRAAARALFPAAVFRSAGQSAPP